LIQWDRGLGAEGRWFRLIDLFLALVAAATWYVAPGRLSWQPLVIATIPWIIRLRARRFPFRRTPFDLLLLLFLMTAAFGVWSAYDRGAAWSKFWIIVGAVLFYYALAGQTQADLPLIAGTLIVLGFLLAMYFLLTHDWQVWPADIDLVTRIGQGWMRLRLSLSAPKLHPNMVGGIIAALFPMLLASNLYLYGRRFVKWLWLSAAVSGFVLFAFLMTSSRAAWLSLVAALCIWLLWRLSQIIKPVYGLSRQLVFPLVLTFLSGLGLWLLLSSQGGPTTMLAKLPGPDNTTTRLELWRQTWRLVEDFPFIGGGLAAFAGLYSNYVRVIPFFMFDYSHNLYLDVALEQGVLGLLSLSGIILGSGWLLAARFVPRSSSRESRSKDSGSWTELKDTEIFRWALFAGLVTMVLHGLVDDALYGGLGTPLLFSLPGMAVTLSSGPIGVRAGLNSSTIPSRPAIAVIIVIIMIGFAFGYRKTLLAAWYANLGAVEMARTELAGWPRNAWDDGRHLERLAPASDLFQRALSSNPENRTAQHRLGAIAMLQRKYDDAVFHLEAAYEQDEEHRGIVKSLGYSYVWAGHQDEAVTLLAKIPEARDEMDVYTWWWSLQGRDDLAAKAGRLVSRLDEANTSMKPQ
jgi:hypothetical protein